MKENRYLTPQEAAKVLNVSISTLKKFIYLGQIRTLKTPGGHHRILERDLFANSSLQLPEINQDSSLFEVSLGFIKILEKRLRFSQGHSLSVSKSSYLIGQRMELSALDLQRLQLAALMHDIGKTAINENILNKPEPFSAEEYSIVKTHPVLGEGVLNAIKPFEELAPIVRQHHERVDGTGYPDGVRKDKICLEARIITVADSFDVMTSPNSYKRQLSKEEALQEIKNNSGAQFDPEVVDVFLKIF